ncbi:arylsulfatase [Lutibacter citreus]|uniref:arylsulfatase n=1 Tax=Lutibacter citreus TaxID=2138210 RepID=UPI000DBE394A|nr:arylsulfatase [Lutibacter citreus]
MKKINIIISIFFLIGFLSVAQTKKKPNVIVILTDDQGYGDLSSHKNPWIKTPEMDKLGEEGVRLTDFHVDPTCAPTRAAIMTGRYSAKVGVWLTYSSRHHLRRDEVTMADVFQQNGYKTGVFGKWHLGDNYPFRPMDRGFDESLIHGGGIIGEAPDYWDNNYYDDIYFRNGKPDKVEGYCTDVWFNETIDFVEKNKDQPFFVYLPTNAPHSYAHVPESYRKPYDQRQAFYGSISCVDENVGKLRRKLKELSLDRKTIVVVFNDNGTAGGVSNAIKGKPNHDGWAKSGFNAGMRGRKGSHYEGGHKAFCFMYWPDGGLIGGKDINGVTSHIDLLPTFIDLCDLKYKEKKRFDGVSLKEAIQNKNSKYLNNRTVVVHNQSRFGAPTREGNLIKYKEYSVMQNNWRLNGDLDKALELYDIKKDIGQRTNLASKYPKVVKELSREYEKWWKKVSKKSDEYCPFVINPSKQKEVKITSQNLMVEDNSVLYSQKMIRQALHTNGYTYIDVEVPGKYLITLRRWPNELDKSIRSADLDYMPMDPSTHVMKRDKQPALAIKAQKARLKVADFDAIKIVHKEDSEIKFEVELIKGVQKIQTWFLLDDKTTTAAYYTYIKNIKE